MMDAKEKITWGDLMKAIDKNGLRVTQWRINDLNKLVGEYPELSLDELIKTKLKDTPL